MTFQDEHDPPAVTDASWTQTFSTVRAFVDGGFNVDVGVDVMGGTAITVDGAKGRTVWVHVLQNGRAFLNGG